jgi:hypothetical protein
VTRYKISQNVIGRIQISAPHADIEQIIYPSVRIKVIILNLTYEWNQTHEKWQMGALKFGSVVVADSKMRRGKMLFSCSRTERHSICILVMTSPISHRITRDAAVQQFPIRSIGDYMKWFCTRINILIYNFWFRMKSTRSIVDMSCLMEKPGGPAIRHCICSHGTRQTIIQLPRIIWNSVNQCHQENWDIWLASEQIHILKGDPFILPRNIDTWSGFIKSFHCHAIQMENRTLVFQFKNGETTAFTKTSIKKTSNWMKFMDGNWFCC